MGALAPAETPGASPQEGRTPFKIILSTVPVYPYLNYISVEFAQISEKQMPSCKKTKAGTRQKRQVHVQSVPSGTRVFTN